MQVHGLRLGVQSWCFRTYKTTDDVIKAVLAAGLDALELCGVHLDLADAAATAAALAQYREAGIQITAFGVDHFGADAAKNRLRFEFARAAGFSAVSADPDDDAASLETIERQCTQYGVKLAVHNHGRRHRYGSIAQLEALFAKTSPNVGLCLDTAWMLDSGENPVAVAEHFADRLYGLHVKDFIFRRDGSPEDVVVGTGNLDLPALFALLDRIHFNGYLTLEYEGDEQNPVPSVRQCVDALQQI